MALKGDRELRARLRALRQTFKPIGRAWADDTVKYARAHVPVKTGKTQKSIRVRNASTKKATVWGRYTVNFIDAGSREHDEVPKTRKAMRYGSNGPVRFAKRVHKKRIAGRPFKRAAALYGLERNPMALVVLKEWNDAA